MNGTRLIEQSNGTDTLHFNYDRNGEVIGFTHFYSGEENDPIMCEYVYVKNAQGDVVGIYNSLGDLKVSYTYDPWGKLLSVESDFGQYERDVSLLNPFRYRGYYYDDETGLYYLQSRYYDPEVGRFINCDDVNYIGTSESEISYNPFAYCENEPMATKDFSGYSINISVRYFNNIYIGKNKQNRHIYLFQYFKYGYNLNYNDASQLGKSYFPAIVIVWDRKYIKLNVCFESSNNKEGVGANKKYIRSFVMENLCHDLAKYSMQCYKEIHSRKYARRSVNGIELEILLHIYMYYFDLDNGYRSSKEIDIDNNRDGLAIELATSSSLINLCKNALKNKKENKMISRILKTIFKIMGR